MAQPFRGITWAELKDKTLFYFRRENGSPPSLCSACRGLAGAGCELPGLGRWEQVKHLWGEAWAEPVFCEGSGQLKWPLEVTPHPVCWDSSGVSSQEQ